MIKRITINIFLLAAFIAVMAGVSLPLSAQMQVNAARRHHHAKRWEKAQAAYENAIALAPLSSEHLIEYGDFLWEMSTETDDKNIFDRIPPLYDQAVEVNPKCAKCRIKRGHILFANDEVDEAIVSFREALALDPNGGDTAFYLKNAALLLLEKDPGYYNEFVELARDFATSDEGKKRVDEILRP